MLEDTKGTTRSDINQRRRDNVMAKRKRTKDNVAQWSY